MLSNVTTVRNLSELLYLILFYSILILCFSKCMAEEWFITVGSHRLVPIDDTIKKILDNHKNQEALTEDQHPKCMSCKCILKISNSNPAMINKLHPCLHIVCTDCYEKSLIEKKCPECSFLFDKTSTKEFTLEEKKLQNAITLKCNNPSCLWFQLESTETLITETARQQNQYIHFFLKTLKQWQEIKCPLTPNKYSQETGKNWLLRYYDITLHYILFMFSNFGLVLETVKFEKDTKKTLNKKRQEKLCFSVYFIKHFHENTSSINYYASDIDDKRKKMGGTCFTNFLNDLNHDILSQTLTRFFHCHEANLAPIKEFAIDFYYNELCFKNQYKVTFQLPLNRFSTDNQGVINFKLKEFLYFTRSRCSMAREQYDQQGEFIKFHVTDDDFSGMQASQAQYESDIEHEVELNRWLSNLTFSTSHAQQPVFQPEATHSK